MQTKLKLYHKLLPLLIIPICLFLFVTFGWSAFSTITERSGMNGNMYYYYNLTRLTYSTYTGLVSLFSAVFILLLTIYLFKVDPIKLTKVFLYFLIFVGLLITCEIYLQTRFTGKG